MSYQTKIFRTIHEIRFDAWQTLTVTSCYLSYGWLEIVEAQLKPNVYYVTVVEGQDHIVAVAPCYKVPEPNIFGTYNVRDLIAGYTASDYIEMYLPAPLRQEQSERAQIIQKYIGPALFPNLLCTALQGYASSPMFHQDLDDQTKHKVAHLLVDAVTQLGQDLACPTTAFLYVEKSNPVSMVLSNSNYFSMGMEAGTCLKLHAGDFNEYLRSLSGKRRAAVRREMKRFQQSGLTVEVQELAGLPTQRLAVLLQNVQVKHQLAEPDVASFEAYIDQLKQIPLASPVYIVRADDEIVGFALFYQYRDALFARVVGFDYILVENAFCYFNILFYQPIAAALRQSLSRIDYGLGALEGKLARGCSLVPMYGYFYTQNSSNDAVLHASAETITLARQRAYPTLQRRFSHDDWISEIS